MHMCGRLKDDARARRRRFSVRLGSSRGASPRTALVGRATAFRSGRLTKLLRHAAQRPVSLDPRFLAELSERASRRGGWSAADGHRRSHLERHKSRRGPSSRGN